MTDAVRHYVDYIRGLMLPSREALLHAGAKKRIDVPASVLSKMAPQVSTEGVALVHCKLRFGVVYNVPGN